MSLYLQVFNKAKENRTKMSNIDNRKMFTTTQIIMISFLAAIIIGGLILTLPCMSADGKRTVFPDALFTATTSVCVTGLVTVSTASHWSTLGHIIILILIQIGGMGTITLVTMGSIVMRRRIPLGERLLIKDAFNMDTTVHMVHFLRNAFFGIFTVEAAGALLYSFNFVPIFGIRRGIWYSIFHSISAFCNAGIDIIGNNSLVPYAGNIGINLITMSLIILGGLGFTVWWELLDLFKNRISRLFNKHRDRVSSPLSHHTKVVLTMTAALIFIAAAAYWLFEHNNPLTIGQEPLGIQLMECLFESVSTRTAGFATFSQKGLLFSSVMLTVILMFIGGSPTGTAGGIKTTTAAVLFLELKSVIQGEGDAVCFRRRIPRGTVRKAFAVFCISAAAGCIAVLLLYLMQPGQAGDIVFEVFSALGTVGLTRDFTPLLELPGKILIIICMYLGRVGPISIMLALTAKESKSRSRYVDGNIRVG